MNFDIKPVEPTDVGYVISSWRETHKRSPAYSRMPWPFFKREVGPIIKRVLEDPNTKLLGAYSDGGALLGWTAVTKGRRVHTLHWVFVKMKLHEEPLRRRGLMLALFEAAELGQTFVYTFRARRERELLPDGTVTKSFDQVLSHELLKQGVVATYVPYREWCE